MAKLPAGAARKQQFIVLSVGDYLQSYIFTSEVSMQILYSDREIVVCVKPVGLDSEHQVPEAFPFIGWIKM